MNDILKQKFNTQLMCSICLYDWNWILGRDYGCYVSKEINGKKVFIIYNPYTDKFKQSIVINDKEFPYPKTIGEFIDNCKSQGIQINLKELKK